MPAIGLQVRRADEVGDRIFIEGNSAAALGCVYGGATVCAWYPITPSSSVAEAFQKYCRKLRVDPETGESRYAIVQAEDEIASIGIVIGAGWNGARAFTATSGPGISLMTEFIGLAYFAEIPVTIIDVQRGGPSTGMPTRTQQADILAAPMRRTATPSTCCCSRRTRRECFELAAAALDLADRLQTPVFVMTDLDIGMNQRLCEPLRSGTTRARYDRGKVMTRRGARGRQATSAATRTSTATASRSARCPARTRPRARTSRAARPATPTRATARPGPTTSTTCSACCTSSTPPATLVPQPVLRAAAKQDALRRDLLRLDQLRPWTRRSTRWPPTGIHLDALRLRAFPFPRQRARVHRRARPGVRRRAEPRRADAHPADQRARGRSGAADRRCCTTTARRSPRASSPTRSPSTCTRCSRRAAASEKDGQHDLPRQAPAAPPDAADATRSATRGATTKARSRRCAPAAATIRSRRRSSRRAGSSTSSRTAWPSCRASAAARKTPDYFLGASHGFNTVHGRMPSVLTGANLANRDLLYLGVSGDGDSASIGLGQFAHAMRRGVNMVYIVENNGVYGLTKGQFSATADRGSKAKKGAVNTDAPVDLVGMALQLGATYVARSFSGDKAQLVPLIKGAIAPRRRGLHRRDQPVRGVQQPRRQHQELRLRARAQRGGEPHRLHRRWRDEITAEPAPGEVLELPQHDGSMLRLRKLHADYDPTDRIARDELPAGSGRRAARS